MKSYQTPILILIIAAFALAGCATTPGFSMQGVDTGLTPKQVTAERESHQDKPVVWGGVIINSRNLKEFTQLEVLAYPLSSYQQPMTENEALGRFLAMHPGYLETADYAQGRYVTLRGVLGKTQTALVGESEYVYPVVHVEQLHLWSRDGEYVEPRVRFGIGVMIRN